MIRSTLTALAFGLLCSTTSAQLYTPNPSNITPEKAQELFTLFQGDYKQNMSTKSECFQRAHLWSHQAERESRVEMSKVYVFFTYKFSMRHRVTSRWGTPFTWWFHVAPAVRVNGELWVLDATFTDRAMPLQDWAKSLQAEEGQEECAELHDLKDYVDDRNISNGYQNLAAVRETCYYTHAPKFVFQPANVGLVEDRKGNMGQIDPYTPERWDRRFLSWALSAYSNSARRSEVKRAMGL